MYIYYLGTVNDFANEPLWWEGQYCFVISNPKATIKHNLEKKSNCVQSLMIIKWFVTSYTTPAEIVFSLTILEIFPMLKLL